jgi:uncharacterized protein (DUF3084 family)
VQSVDQRQREAVFQHRPHRLPIDARDLHRDLTRTERLQPIAQGQQPITVVLNSATYSLNTRPSHTRTHAVTVALWTSSAPGRSTTRCMPASTLMTSERVRGSLAFSSDAVARALMATVRGSGIGSYALLSRGLTGTKQKTTSAHDRQIVTRAGRTRERRNPGFQPPVGGRTAVTTSRKTSSLLKDSLLH